MGILKSDGEFEQDYDIYMAAAHQGMSVYTQASIYLNLAGHDAVRRAKLFVYAPAILDAHGQEITSAETMYDLYVSRESSTSYATLIPISSCSDISSLQPKHQESQWKGMYAHYCIEQSAATSALSVMILLRTGLCVAF